MWRDRDRYPEHNLVPDTFWLVIAALLFAACGLVWLIGQVAAIVFGAHHQHLPVRLVDMLGVLLRLPGTWDDPAQAWSPDVQPLLPGPVGMSESGVRNLIRRGTLRAVQLDGRWLIPAAVIEDKLGVSLDARPASDAASIRPMTGQPPPGGDLDVA